ncbi:MAG: retropepsin-like aspartic protease [Chloroflexota bacterium]|nr:retropepsin-like aspartic protease [Chloroflexota bacterium]
MQLTLRDDLLLLPVTVTYQGRQVQIPDLVVDTGSAATMMATDAVAQVGITPDPQDILHVVRGVGGTEVVFSRRVDCLQIGTRAIEQFEIEVGGIDAAFDINGILGLDFLLQTGAILDLGSLRLDFPPGEKQR